jgi:hypothetical protein
MNSSLLSRIFWSCPHQFTWPRSDEAGGYYQLCVKCGAKYLYDWKTMRRTARVDEEDVTSTAVRRRAHKNTWKARERRLRHVVPVLYRFGKKGEWLEGTSVNLSRSGLLFRASSEAALGIRVEVKLQMPEELTGESDVEVLCHAVVARATHVEGKQPPTFLIACSIEDYEFDKKPAHAADSRFTHEAQA